MSKALALAPVALLTAQAPPPEAEVAIGSDRGKRMTVPVSIAGRGPFAFVVDTGAERSVISRELAETLALASKGPARLHSMSGASKVPTVLIPSLSIEGKAGATAIRAPALEGRHIGGSGLIGLDSLQDRRIVIDFKRGRMSVSPASAPRVERDRDEIVVTARARHGQLILVDASVGGSKVRAFIDTGSEVSVGNRALRRRLLGRSPPDADAMIDLVSVTGAKTLGEYRQVGAIKLAGVTFTHLPVAFADAAPFERLGLADKPALLIGMDALRLFDRVSVDFANKKVRFLLPGDARRDGERLAGARSRLRG